MAKKGFNWQGWALFGAVLGAIGGIFILFAFSIFGALISGITGAGLGAGLGIAAIAIFALVGAITWTFLGFLWDTFGFKEIKNLPAFQELFAIMFAMQLLSLLASNALNVTSAILAGIVVLLELVLVFAAYMIFKWKLPVK